MKIFKKINYLLLIMFCLITFCNHVFADGGFFIRKQEAFYWEIFRIANQAAIISYKNGTQEMLLLINIPEGDVEYEKAVWIFPVPATPDKVTIKIVREIPKYIIAENIIDVAKEEINYLFSSIRLSQLYSSGQLFRIYFTEATGTYFKREEVTVHQHIEKEGIVSELVTASNGEALYNYLSEKKLYLPETAKTIMEYYIGKNYSFVITWIQTRRPFLPLFPGYESFGTISLLVTFPTEKIYFPLKLTSVYNDITIPITIYTYNHVTPELYPEIKKCTKVEYLVWVNDEYTKIKIECPAKYFVEDLWIENKRPKRLEIVQNLITYLDRFKSLIFIIISCLASMFAGIIALKNYDVGKKKLALIGLFNIFSILGFSLASYIFLKGFGEIKRRKLYKFIPLLFASILITVVLPISINVGLLTIAQFYLSILKLYIIYVADIIATITFLIISIIVYSISEQIIEGVSNRKEIPFSKIYLFVITFSIVFIILSYIFEGLINLFIFLLLQ